MEVILLEKTANLGNLGDIVRVKDGYARNFLLPRKVARRATAAAIKEFEARRAELEKVAAEKLAAAPSKFPRSNCASAAANASASAGAAGCSSFSIGSSSTHCHFSESSLIAAHPSEMKFAPN